jgi:hypothetical protein
LYITDSVEEDEVPLESVEEIEEEMIKEAVPIESVEEEVPTECVVEETADEEIEGEEAAGDIFGLLPPESLVQDFSWSLASSELAGVLRFPFSFPFFPFSFSFPLPFVFPLLFSFPLFPVSSAAILSFLSSLAKGSSLISIVLFENGKRSERRCCKEQKQQIKEGALLNIIIHLRKARYSL